MIKTFTLRTVLCATVLSYFGITTLNAQTHAPVKTKNNVAEYAEKTVVFRVLPQFRNECADASIADAAMQSVFVKLGMPVYSKLYPRHKQPETQYNQNGDPLIDLSLIYEIHYNANINVYEAAKMLMHTGKLMYAEPHYIYRTTFTPNDPQAAAQYHLTKINAYNGWNVEQGDTNVVIGIVDTGTDPTHPDLAANLKHNYADPINGLDDDGDGYIDNYSGWDVSEVDNDPTVDASDHGSHVSGCADAVTNNGIGVAASGFKCKFLPVKVAKATSTNAIDNGYEGIVYAADHGCNVINCSWGGPGGGSYAQNVIDYATFNKNVTVIVSAGNNNNEVPQYPAAFDNVFAIGSTNSTDSKSNFSTYGYFVDMCAPGSSILATVYPSSYTQMSGTSMASPIAAGCAAIIKSHFPTFTALQVGEQMRVTCDNIYGVGGNATYQNKLGKGRINMYKALTQGSPSIRFLHMQAHDGNDDAFVSGDTIRITGVFKNYLSPTTNLTATLSTASTFVTVLNSTVSLGAIATLDSMDNYSNAYMVKINPTAPLNSSVLFKITYSDGTYTDFEIFYMPVNVDYINVNINQVATTITSKGRIGWNDDGQIGGLGFVYKGSNMIYDGGLMIGKNTSTVSDVIRGTGTANDADFGSTSAVQQLIPALKSDFDTKGVFSDNISTTPLNISVAHKSYAWSNAGDDKYIIVQYTIKNKGTAAITNLYAGTCFDWDIMNYALNRASVDNTLRMGYAYSTEVAGLYGGSKLLTGGGFNHYALDNYATPPGGSIDISDGYDTGEKYTSLSTQRTDAGTVGNGNDILDVVSTGPYTINGGDSITVAFAIIAGDDLADLTLSATNAQIKYDGISGLTNLSANSFALSVVPNPASSAAQIKFNLTANDHINISIYDALGNKVVAVADKDYSQGNHTIDLNTFHLNAGIYYAQLNNGSSNAAIKFTIVK